MAVLGLLLACERGPVVLPPAQAVSIVGEAPPPPPVAVVAPPPPRVEPEACAPAPPAKGAPFQLSVTKRVAADRSAGKGALNAFCNDLGIATKEEGLKLFDPRGDRFFSQPVKTDAIVALAANGGLVVYEERNLSLRRRSDGAVAWQRTAASGRLFPAGDVIVQTAGCAVVAVRTADGTEAWKRPCSDPAQPADARPDQIVRVDDALLVRSTSGAIEVWDVATGHTRLAKARGTASSAIHGRWFTFSDEREVSVMDATGRQVAIAPLPKGQTKVEAIATDGTMMFVATSDATEYGGRARVGLFGFAVETHAGFRARGPSLSGTIERRHASTPPALWADRSAVYLHDPDTGFLTAFDRATGDELSSIGVAQRELTRTTAGFATLGEEGLTLIEPAEAETPLAENMVITGTFRLDGKPKGDALLVVGSQEARTGADGRFTMKVRGRGRIEVRARQPTSAKSTAHWANADAVVVTDGRKGPYSVTIDARKDTLE